MTVVVVEWFQLAYRSKALVTFNMASRNHELGRQECVYIVKGCIEEKSYSPIRIQCLIERLEECKIVAGLIEVSVL